MGRSLKLCGPLVANCCCLIGRVRVARFVARAAVCSLFWANIRLSGRELGCERIIRVLVFSPSYTIVPLS